MAVLPEEVVDYVVVIYLLFIYFEVFNIIYLSTLIKLFFQALMPYCCLSFSLENILKFLSELSYLIFCTEYCIKLTELMPGGIHSGYQG